MAHYFSVYSEKYDLYTLDFVTAGGKSSKNTLNGPTSAPGGGGGVSPGRAGQRRQNGSPELGAERGDSTSRTLGGVWLFYFIYVFDCFV